MEPPDLQRMTFGHLAEGVIVKGQRTTIESWPRKIVFD
jgi:hypothetical protein